MDKRLPLPRSNAEIAVLRAVAVDVLLGTESHSNTLQSILHPSLAPLASLQKESSSTHGVWLGLQKKEKEGREGEREDMWMQCTEQNCSVGLGCRLR